LNILFKGAKKLGTWIDFSKVLTIGNKSFSNGIIKELGYSDLTLETFQKIHENDKIQCIQIMKNLPRIAFDNIDKILKVRPDISFRIFGLNNESYFDLDVLHEMPHLVNFILNAHLASNPKIVEPEKLCKLKNLKNLSLDLFDLKDYSFIQGLSNNLEELLVMADTMNGTPVFDCSWLLKFQKLNSLQLGKKAKKNIKAIAEMPSLHKLALRGIKVDDFYFLRNSNIEELRILWCGMNNLSSLSVFENLKYLELWRIPKLNDISIISNLKHLETLKLQDLSHIQALPDLSKLSNLKKLVLINTPIDETSIPNDLKPLIEYW